MATCYYITNEGYKKLCNEIEELEFKQLPTIVNEVSVARGNGDLSENAEYHAAKNKQREIMKKIGILKDYKVKAQIIDCANINSDTVKFGVCVEIVDLDTDKHKKLHLVGDYEADVSNGFISVSAPLGSALLGKKEGEIVEFEMNGKVFAYEIIKITK